MEEFVATGRRKRAVVSIRLRRGSGNIDVNGRKFEEYFLNDIQRKTILSPLVKLGIAGSYDLVVRVKGGGIAGQAEAARLGISRALCQEDATRRGDLKGWGYLTRDPRMRERKKYGQPGARKRFQFSKR